MKKSQGNPVKSKTIHSRLKKTSPIFQLRTEESDCKVLTAHCIKETRKSGVLKLSGKGLGSVPPKVWTLNDLDENEVHSLDLCLDHDDSSRPWWEFVPLSVLDLSSNMIHEISPRISNLVDLTVLSFQDNCLENLPEQIGCLEKLTKLNLSRNKLRSLPTSLYRLRELKWLNLSNNNLESLDEALGDLIMLEFLDLSNNGLLYIPDGTGFLTRLTHLNIANNRLVDIPPDLTNMRVLRILDLSNNQLATLPPLGQLYKLEILYLQCNSLTSIPDVEGCKLLKELHLSTNCISEVSAETLETITSLSILVLRDNDISSLPEEIIMMQHLTRLDLSNNSLTKLPDSLGFLPHLQNLQLEGNPLRSIRKDVLSSGTTRLLRYLRSKVEDVSDIQKPVNSKEMYPDNRVWENTWSTMRNSRSLSLSSKQLKDIPVNVFEEAAEAEVVSVDLSKNLLSTVPDGLTLLAQRLKDVNLSCNSLSKLSPRVAQCFHLQYLNLERNMLQDLPLELGALENLRELVISYNRFTTVPECVYELRCLEILLAQGNVISCIDVAGLSRLSRLAVLNLADNEIDHVPAELGNLTQLRTVELVGNKFRTPRHAVLEKGTEHLLSYLRDRIPQLN